MKKIIPTLFLPICFLLGCKKEEPVELPSCIQDQIPFLENSSCPNPNITRYLTQMGHVYEVNFGLCIEGSSTFFDNECNVICSRGGDVASTDCVVDGVQLKLIGPKVVWPE